MQNDGDKLSIPNLLKYANLQMAAEAFLTEKGDPSNQVLVGAALKDALLTGNEHASRFTAVGAENFVKHWSVVAQQPNTGSGFSGTVFECVNDDPATGAKKGERVLCFRSTEFVDDAARDNVATNTLEIKETGFAWGQLQDMEEWYAKLLKDDVLKPGQFSVTGYSLGGHLATAFNVMHNSEVSQVVTFNGAGIGGYDPDKTLSSLVKSFAKMRADGFKFDDPTLDAIYRRTRDAMAQGLEISEADKGALAFIAQNGHNNQQGDSQAVLDAERLQRAVKTASLIAEEVKRLKTDIKSPTTPVAVELTSIAQYGLDYQLALLEVRKSSDATGLVKNLIQTFNGRVVHQSLKNQFDVQGDTSPSAVANSQLHVGEEVRVFIEDQPLLRGEVIEKVLDQSWKWNAIKLLVDGYDKNDFGDTHSLVLLVDSLSVQNTLLNLAGPLSSEQLSSTSKLIDRALRDASNRRKETKAGEQGKAEGDALERAVNALADLFLGATADGKGRLKASNVGGTWADMGDELTIGRQALHNLLKRIQDSALYKEAAAGRAKLTLIPTDALNLNELARNDFGVYAALYSGSPFAIQLGTGELKDAAMTAAWGWVYQEWNEDRKRVAGELDPSDTSPRYVSDKWLSERAEYLRTFNDLNAKNLDYVKGKADGNGGAEDSSLKGLYDADDVIWEDRDREIKIWRSADRKDGAITARTRHIVFGSDKNRTTSEEIAGTEGSDIYFGGQGNDVLSGGASNDRLDGGSGNDTLLGGDDVDVLIGGAGNDELAGGDGSDALFGGDGDDKLDGGSGTDFLNGGAGSDELRGGDGVDYLFDQGGADTTKLWGDDGNDVLEVKGGSGEVTLDGGTGNDILIGGQGKNTLDGGKGNDSIRGGDGVDTITAGEDADFVEAGAGDDDITGGKGADYLKGGAGGDTYRYTGRDFGVDVLEDGQGGDKILVDGAQLGTATYDDAKRAWVLGNGMEVRKHIGDGTTTLALNYSGDQLNTIYLRNWSPGQFGISLAGEPKNPERPQVALFGPYASALNNFVDFRTDDLSDDALDGGSGNDVLFGTDDKSVLVGGTGNDLLSGFDGDDWLEGGDDQDVIFTGEGKDYADGGAGDDLLMADVDFWVLRNDDKLFFPAHDDPVERGWLYSNSIYTGGPFTYSANGQSFSIAHPELSVFDVKFETKRAELPGYDGYLFWQNFESSEASLEPILKLTVQIGDVSLGGGEYLQPGKSIAETPANLGQPIALQAMLKPGGKMLRPGTNSEGVTLHGGAGNDVVYGANNNDKLFGDADDDRLIGYDGNDELDGGDGNDELSGGDGRDDLKGGAGNDYLVGGYGADVLSGGEGNDTLLGDATNLYPTNTYPTGLDTSRMGGDYLMGGAGNDSLWGNHGDDYLFGGADNDGIAGEDGNDHAFGDAGQDSLWGGKGDDFLDGGSEDDMLSGDEGDDVLLGGGGDDNLQGGEGHDILDGGAGTDQLYGEGGSDILRGGAGDDHLYGDGGESADGDDILEGGAGNDQLYGGGGSDIYVFSKGDGQDTVRDDGNNGSRNLLTFKFDSKEIRALKRDGLDLLIQYGISDQVRVANFYAEQALSLGSGGTVDAAMDGGPAGSIAEIAFEDGTTWDRDDILAMAPPPPPSEVQPDPFAALSPQYFVNALLSREAVQAAGKHALTFTFSASPSPGATGAVDFTNEQKQAVREALARFSQVLDLRFTEVAGYQAADLSFRLDDLTSAGMGGFAGYATPATGEIHLNSTFFSLPRKDEFGNSAPQRSLNVGTPGFEVLLHEIGHALGLKHPFEPPVLPNAENNTANTVMSYTRSGEPATQLAAFDVAALQLLFGVSKSINAGHDEIVFGQQRWIQDSRGTDWLNASAETQDVYIDLTPGSWIWRGAKASSILADNQAFIGFGTQIEEATGGSGNDTLIGSADHNILRGGAGNDVLRGGAGEDQLIGGDGSDTYLWAPGSEGETVFETGSGDGDVDIVRILGGLKPADVQLTRLANDLVLRHGNDRMVVRDHFSGSSVEALVFDDGTRWDLAAIRANVTTGMTEYADVFIGSSENDRVDGYAGNDRLEGGEGDDTLLGSAGDDTLIGDAGNDSLVGGDGSDSLLGGAGDDVLDDGESMDGGTGSDTYRWGAGTGLAVITDATRDAGDVDTLRLRAGVLPADLRLSRAGSDLRVWRRDGDAGLTISGFFDGGVIERFVFEDGTVWDSAAIAAAIAANPGQLTQGTAGNDAHTLTPFDDTFNAGAGDDRIDGKDGNDRILSDAGNDTIRGGTGSDTLEGGLGDDQLAGDAGDDLLDGGQGANLLDGGAGSDRLSSVTRGARDTMLGGDGDDSYTMAYGANADIIASAIDASAASNDVYTAVPLDGNTSSDVSQTWTITDGGGASDELRFTGAAVTAASTVIRSTGNGFSITSANLKVVIENALTATGTAGAGAIEKITLGDGTVYGLSDLMAASLRSTSGDDSIIGFGGDDTLDGGAGNDTLSGGRGNDTYRFGKGSGQDVIAETSGTNDSIEFGPGITASDLQLARAGDDLLMTIRGSSESLRFVGWGLSADQRVEQFKFADGSTVSADQLMRNYDLSHMGDAGNNTLTGTAGDDQFNAPVFLSAGTWSRIFNPTSIYGLADGIRGGVDTMIGGAGDDIYYTTSVNGEGTPYINYESDLAAADDIVIEKPDEGHDTVVTTAYHATLADNVEDLVSFSAQNYTITPYYQSLQHNYTGNSLNNVIDASRVLKAVRIDGGQGADTMIGNGDASNTYVVDNLGDVIVEAGLDSSLSSDTVQASISYTLGDKMENLVLTGTAATAGTGNAQGNVLDGSGNAAANTLTGGLGDDIYRVDAADVVVEHDGEGTDRVVIVSAGGRTSVSLDAYQGVERLELDEAAGALTMQGSDRVDIFRGNSANNLMIGAGGNDVFEDGSVLESMWSRISISGTDTMDGGAGNDTLNSIGGDDLIIGGTGDDQINFFFSRSQFMSARMSFQRGDGSDQINVEGESSDVKVLFGAGIEASEITLLRQGNDLRLQLANPGDALTFHNTFSSEDSNVFGMGFSLLKFADGIEITRQQMQARFTGASTNVATEDPDLLIGGAGADTLAGAGGDDQIAAGAGDDDLSGGTGGDRLAGGLGNDIYRFDRGDGRDIITDAGGVDTVVFGAGISESAMTVVLAGSDLILTFGNDQLTIAGGASPAGASAIESVRFANGTQRDLAYLLSIAAIRGTSASESMTGTEGNDRLDGYYGDDTLSGLGGNDWLSGGWGIDVLDGGAGVDTMVGGIDDDIYIVDNGADTLIEDDEWDVDLVRASVSYTLPDKVENIVLTGTASISATGNALNNTLEGNAGANRLDGGAGADTMKGYTGDDSYVVDNAGDVIVENANEGTDTIETGFTWTLAKNFENLTLTGTAALNGTGNTVNNVLTGNDGANVLDGLAGADTMQGGGGNDVYKVDNVLDVVIEKPSSGTDRVESTVTYTLSADVEQLTLLGTGNLNGTGNASANTLLGNAGINRLDGGAGADSMTGGAGNDTYVVDNAGDLTVEAANGGTDTVESSVTWSLMSETENLTLTGDASVNGTGTAQNNTLRGNTGNNLLSGLAGNDSIVGGAGDDTLDGGAGVDTLVGGTGNDTYVIDATTDVITENANEGIDTVVSAVTLTLATNLENVTLSGTTGLGATGNAANNVMTGNAGANALSGAAGNDTLDGAGGNDTLTGGTGADGYVFGRGYGSDTIVENDATTGVKDFVSFGATIAKGDISFQKSGNALLAKVNGTSDVLTLQDWYLGSKYHVEEFRFGDGTVLTDTQAQALVSAMAAFSSSGTTSSIASASDSSQRMPSMAVSEPHRHVSF